MGIRTQGGAAPPSLGGAAREIGIHYNGSIAQKAGFDEWTDVAARNAMARYGEQAPSYTDGGGGPMWDNGASGGAGNRGKGAKYFKGLRASFIGNAQTLAAAVVPNDFYSRLKMTPITEIPVNVLNYPFAAWRLRVLMGINIPAAVGPIIGDCGIVCLAGSGVTAYASGFITNTANNQPGFAVFFDGAAGQFVWRSRKGAAGAVTETVVLGPGGQNIIHQVDLLISSATPSAEAKVVVSINGTPVLTRAWGAGTVLPNRTDFATWGGVLVPYLRNADSQADGNADLYVVHAELSAAANESLLL